MRTQLTIDRAGRIVLPKRLRDQLDLSAGDSLDLETSGDAITLRPRRPAPMLQKERGVWVFRTGEKLPESAVEDTIRQIRDERDRAALGRKR